MGRRQKIDWLGPFEKKKGVPCFLSKGPLGTHIFLYWQPRLLGYFSHRRGSQIVRGVLDSTSLQLDQLFIIHSCNSRMLRALTYVVYTLACMLAREAQEIHRIKCD